MFFDILTVMNGNHNRKGFSLLELLLYLGIFAIVGGVMFAILTRSVSVSTTEIANDEVSSQLNTVMQTISQLVKSSSEMDIATSTATTTLKLRMPIAAQDPTCIYMSGGVLKLAQGPAQPQPSSAASNCTSTTTDLTTNKIVVDSLLFKKISIPGGHDQVAIDIQVSSNNTGSKISRALHAGISRVSAATFDSDLLPNQDASYEVGFAGTKRWKNISIANFLNLGVSNGVPAGIPQAGSIYYDSASSTFRGYNGSSWSNLGSSLWMATSTNSMYANVSGNVGIGTTSPNVLFHTYGGRVRMESAGSTSTTSDDTLHVETVMGGANTSAGIQITNGNSNYWRMVTYGNNGFGIGYNGATQSLSALSISSAGNVGIGTSAPNAELHVKGAIQSNVFRAGISDVNSLTIGQSGGGYSDIGYNVNYTAVTNQWKYSGTDQASLIDFYNGGFKFWGSPTVGVAGNITDMTSLMTISSNGNVGIGSEPPRAKLFVIKNTGGAAWNSDESDWAFKIEDGTADVGLLLGVSNVRHNAAIQAMDPGTTWGGRDLLLQPNGGNVGIGTTAPAYKLESKGNIVNSNPSVGYIGLTGDLPGYPNDTYPTIKTSYTNLYFSAGGLFSAYMTAAGVWTSVSDKNKKENFVPLNSQEVLEKIGQLPIMEWNFKSENAGVRHIGPFAQDFYRAFHLNGTNDKMISTIDPSGVALVGIQGLLERSKEQQKQINELKAEVAKLKHK